MPSSMQFIMNAPITIDAVINQTKYLETERVLKEPMDKKTLQSKKAQKESRT